MNGTRHLHIVPPGPTVSACPPPWSGFPLLQLCASGEASCWDGDFTFQLCCLDVAPAALAPLPCQAGVPQSSRLVRRSSSAWVIQRRSWVKCVHPQFFEGSRRLPGARRRATWPRSSWARWSHTRPALGGNGPTPAAAPGLEGLLKTEGPTAGVIILVRFLGVMKKSENGAVSL